MKLLWKRCNLALSLADLWALVSRTNKYIDETTPWVLARDEDERGSLASVMAHLVASLTTYCSFVTTIYDKIPEKNY